MPIVGRPGGPQCQQFVQREPQTVDVAAGVGVAAHLFGGHVPQGSDNVAALRNVVAFDGFGQPEVGHPDNALPVEQQVGRLDIAVQNSLFVSKLQRPGRLDADIDAVKAVSDAVNKFRSPERAFILVTHYERILNYVTPDHVHVLAGGKVVMSGDMQLALELEAKGYDWITNGSAVA